jgi:hypothetical protein
MKAAVASKNLKPAERHSRCCTLALHSSMSGSIEALENPSDKGE